MLKRENHLRRECGGGDEAVTLGNDNNISMYLRRRGEEGRVSDSE